MKVLHKLFAVALALSLAAVGAQAQTFYTYNEHNAPENGNKNEDSTTNRGAYLTNAWYDNWSIGIAGGVQTLIASGNGKLVITPNVELNVSKWVTPTIGFRIGYQGFKVTENSEERKQICHYQPKRENGQYKFNELYLHGDFMVSLTNLFGGYKETRFVNVVPYAHAGYYRLSHPDYKYFNPKREDGEMMRDREVAFGPGVLFNFRLSDHMNLTLDIRDIFFSTRYHDYIKGGIAQDLTAALGLNYTFKKWYWTRLKTAETPLRNSLDDAKNALAKAEQRNADLQKQVDALTKDMDALRKSIVPHDELTVRVKESDLFLLFDIGKPTLNFPEQVYLERFVLSTLADDSNHVFYITGSADKGTGNTKINTRLSSQRAENVKKILMDKYNVPASQIVIKATLISDAHEDGRLDRCVLIENK